MEGCIISPLWVYLLGIVPILRVICFAVAVVATLILVLGIDTFFEESNRKYIKWFIIVIIVFSLLAILIPSKETLIAMKVAEYATYENAEIAVLSIKDAVDYVIEAIGKLK